MSRPSDRLVIHPLDVLRLRLLAAPDLDAYATVATDQEDAYRAAAAERIERTAGTARACPCRHHASDTPRPGCECFKWPGVYHGDDNDRDIGMGGE